MLKRDNEYTAKPGQGKGRIELLLRGTLESK